jgi:hypothetical protein
MFDEFFINMLYLLPIAGKNEMGCKSGNTATGILRATI